MTDSVFTFTGTSPELTALEADVRQLVSDQAVTDPRLDAVEGRVGELEVNVGALEANVNELEDGADDTAARVTALVTSTGTALASLRTDLSALAARVVALESAQPTQPPPTPPPTPPTGPGDNSTVPADLLPLSAWPAVLPVTHGYYDLNPRKLASVAAAGKPVGYYLRGVGVSAPAALKDATRYTFATAGEVVRDQRFTSAVSVTADGVTFVNCEITGGSGFQFGVALANGSAQNAVKITNGSASFVDCTIQGAQAATVVGAFRAFRTLIREGGDAVNTRITSDGRGCEFYQSVIDGSKRNVPEKHSDAIQSTTNSPSTSIHTVKMDQSWDQVDNDRTGDYGNSCWQMGHFGSTAGGVRGVLTRSALSGGNYKLNAQSDAVHDVTVRDCVLVQNSRYGDSTGGVAIDYSVNVRVDEQGNRI